MHGLRRHYTVPVLVALLLGLHAFLACSSAWNKAPTVDEYTYIATGYLYWQTGDLRLDRTHPPLLRWLIGAPLQSFEVSLPPLQRDLWDTPQSYELGYRIGWDMLLTHNENWQSLLFRARVPIIVLSLGTALVVFLWARELYGNRGGLISLVFTAFCPTLLAHGRLATLDAGTTFLMTLALYLLYRYCRQPSVVRILPVGCVLGLALSAKVIALLWVPLVLGAIAAVLLQKRKSEGASMGNALWLHPVVSMGVALVALGLTYGFPFNPIYYGDTLSNVFSKSLQGGAGGEAVPGMPHRNHAFYLLGDYSLDGFPHYYVVALAVKLPLAAFVVLAWVFFRRETRYRGWADALLFSAIALILFASVLNRVTIGVRHVLPVVPLLYVVLGRVGLLMTKRGSKALGVVLLLWFVGSNLLVFPNYIAYFNELAGGPGGGHRVLDDSNLDWGQDLTRLQAIQARFPDEPLTIATDKAFVAEAFGVQARPFTMDMIASPPEGVVVVGKQWAIRNRVRRTGVWFNWLERFTPVEDIGGSMWLYRFDAEGNPLPG